jgi:DNA polymerase III subunit gamma/tau
MVTPESNQSGYLVIARKYRPQLFDEIVGQESTARTLRNAIEQHRIAHAYLFAGVRGVGKTTTARILAKALNCINGPTVTPCNQCDSCREITAGNSLDVLEIDAASNRGIDEIRELRENVKYRPARDRYKVFIIDEVHMLTTEAFNALLKTLEEPPEHAVFVLATTELHKVPSTILSRCQHFNFRAIERPAILLRLREIAASEQVLINDSSLNDIVTAAEGSMRDAQSIFDQVISFCGKEVDEARVREMLGVIPQQILLKFAEAIIAADSHSVIQLVDQMVSSGRNLQQFVRDMLLFFRHLLLLKIAGRDSQLVPLAEEHLVQMEDQVQNFSEEDLMRFFNILVRTEGELRWSSQPRLHLEMGLLKIVQAKRLVPLEKLLAGLQGLAAGVSPTHEKNSCLPGSTPRPPAPQAKAATLSQSPREDPMDISSPSGSPTLAQLKAVVARHSPMIAALLDHAQALRTGDSVWEIQFESSQKFYIEMLQSSDNLEVLQKAAGELAGGAVFINLTSSQGAPAVPLAETLVAPASTQSQLIDRMKSEAMVKAYLDAFQGEITSVKELENEPGKDGG